ncbi:hypothetical protein BZM26_37680 [Paraburkholderia strydomiana]|nr:hypothetical protein BZM26_37680 [Paraburkholderia strydomiana]
MKIEREALLKMAPGAARAKLLGSFYTPDVIARILARWGIRTTADQVLEPSAGNGALAKAALQRAHELSTGSTCRITAFDIDPAAIQNLRGQRLPRTTVIEADFLAQAATSFPKFDVVLANPPFNRNHSIPEERRTALRRRFNIHGASGLWVHFVLHSLDFLRKGGRIAFIVPRTAIFTKHGDALLRRLCGQFASLGIYELPARPVWSSRAEEAGAVILADRYGEGVVGDYERGFITEDAVAVAHNRAVNENVLKIQRQCVPLGEIADVSIGAVTGRNNVFLMTEADRRLAGLGRNAVIPIVSKSVQLRGTTLGVDDLRKLSVEGHKTLLLYPTRFSKRVRTYLSVISDEEREEVVWFRKRHPWWRVQLAERYDAVFTYMNDAGPRVVLLENGIVCTNTLHRVAFRAHISRDQRISAALTGLSTFGQLAAEQVGRVYGGGLLKFELAEARKLPVLSLPALFNESLMKQVDKALRGNNKRHATEVIDETIMRKLFGSRWKSVNAELSQDLVIARNERRSASNTQGEM